MLQNKVQDRLSLLGQLLGRWMDSPSDENKALAGWIYKGMQNLHLLHAHGVQGHRKMTKSEMISLHKQTIPAFDYTKDGACNRVIYQMDEEHLTEFTNAIIDRCAQKARYADCTGLDSAEDAVMSLKVSE